MRESCCYAFSGIVQALNGSPESLQLIQRNIQPMLQLIVQIANSHPQASENLYSSACALAGDLLHSFGVEFLPVVDTAEFGISTLVNKCRRSRTNKAKSIASWVSPFFNFIIYIFCGLYNFRFKKVNHVFYLKMFS